MTTHSDFAIIPFAAHLGADAYGLQVPWATFYGNQTPVQTFEIDGKPTETGYMLIQTLAVGLSSHKILINGHMLSGLNLPQHDGWQTWMIVIDVGLLRHGTNTVQFVRDAMTNDSFVVGNVVVHWREVEADVGTGYAGVRPLT
ncbi:MAG: hypothetical protein IPK19_06620 [Chloroflexi bacterium]|nr:hypothetical protein [Chloroflexota bacterium]